MDRTTKNSSDLVGLFVVSFLSLFLELAVIRWIPGVVQAIAYFTNIILIATFVGLGLGCAISTQKQNLFWLPTIFTGLISACIFLKKIGIFYPSNLSDLIFSHTNQGVPMAIAIPLIFFLCFYLFMHIGMILGRYLKCFSPLIGYSINVLASLLGTVVFTILSFYSASPMVWFSIAFILMLFFLRKHIVYSLLCFFSCLLLLYIFSGNSIWSAYQKLEVSRSVLSQKELFSLNVNNFFYQTAFDFSPQTVNDDPCTKHWEEIYSLPYSFAAPKSVLIVGSGVGNDTAIALKNKIPKITAVEIDAAIINIARRLRPQDIYNEDNVRVFVDDARSYFNKCFDQYDLIVYGFLDSHALFTNMAGVRLDNFVYTIEGIKKAKSLLSQDGTIALSFFVSKPWVGNKIYYMLKDVFGKQPLAFASTKWPTETIFIISNNDKNMAKKEIPGFIDVSQKYAGTKPLPLPTDDWPYFYMENKTIPLQYLMILFIILTLSAASIAFHMPKKENMKPYASFLFLGAAFMLIETKSIVQLSLLFGTTWLVNAIVISAILSMVLLANICTLRCKPANIEMLYLFLSLSLLFSWFFNPQTVTLPDQLLATLLFTTLAVLPLFFAAMIFASLFKKTDDQSVALGANLLGAALGGFLEYFSLLGGLNKLTILALLIYFFAYAAYKNPAWATGSKTDK